MEHESTTLSCFAQELEAMIKVCFEGTTERTGTVIRITLPHGQTFSLACDYA